MTDSQHTDFSVERQCDGCGEWKESTVQKNKAGIRGMFCRDCWRDFLDNVREGRI